MKIATVTLNPAIDQTVQVDNFQLNRVNRGLAIKFDASGKGVNVASFLADYGYNTAVTGYLSQLLMRLTSRRQISICLVKLLLRKQ